MAEQTIIRSEFETEVPGAKIILAQVLLGTGQEAKKLHSYLIKDPTNGKAGGDLFARRSRQRGRFLGPGRYSTLNSLENYDD